MYECEWFLFKLTFGRVDLWFIVSINFQFCHCRVLIRKLVLPIGVSGVTRYQKTARPMITRALRITWLPLTNYQHGNEFMILQTLATGPDNNKQQRRGGDSTRIWLTLPSWYVYQKITSLQLQNEKIKLLMKCYILSYINGTIQFMT